MQNHLQAAALIFVLSITAAAQKQACAEAKLRASMAESRLAAERLKSETIAARLENVSSELVKQRGQSNALEQRLKAEQQQSASLAGTLDIAERKIANLEKALAERDKTIRDNAELIEHNRQTIASLAAERNRALHKAKSANKRTWLVVIGAGIATVLGIVK